MSTVVLIRQLLQAVISAIAMHCHFSFLKFEKEKELWKIRRRLWVSTFNELKVNEDSMMELVIKQEAKHLVQAIWAFHGQAFDPGMLFASAGSNIVLRLIFGQRYEYNDQQFQNLLTEQGKVSGLSISSLSLPALSHVFSSYFLTNLPMVCTAL